MSTAAIKFKESRSGTRYTYAAGQIVELPYSEAERFVARGLAEFVEPRKGATPATASNPHAAAQKAVPPAPEKRKK